MYKQDIEDKDACEIYSCLKEISNISTVFKLRRQFNPHHSEKDKKFEELKVNSHLTDLSIKVVEKYKNTKALLMTSPDKEARTIAENITKEIKQKFGNLDEDTILSLLQKEKQHYANELKILETQPTNCPNCNKNIEYTWKTCPFCSHLIKE